MLKMNKINLYNQDGSLCAEAQPLIHNRPNDISRSKWRKTLKEFRSLLSAEDLKEFERLRHNAKGKAWCEDNPEKSKRHKAKWRAENPEKIKQDAVRWRAENPEKVKQNNAKWYAENPEKKKAQDAKWKAGNPEKKKAQDAKWKAGNPEKVKESNAKWYAENVEKQKQNNAKWYAENSEKVKQDSVKWKAENPEKFKEHQRKQRSTPHDKLRKAVSNAFKRIGQNKPTDTLKLLGCTWEEAKAHIESLFQEGMTWENHGRGDGKWQIDHIRPVASFKGASEEELKQMNHIFNLQPLWAIDNIKKGDKWDRELNSEILNFEV